MNAVFDNIRLGKGAVVGEGMPFASVSFDDHLGAIIVWAATQRQADARATAIVAGLNALDQGSDLVRDADLGGTREVADGPVHSTDSGWSTDPQPAVKELEAGPGRCQEASIFSRERYIPCNAPAIVLIDWLPREERAIRMCSACASHNVHNRGGRIVRELTAEERAL